jgi:hypothetical protein
MPIWRKKFRMAQRVDVSALMDQVTPAPPVRRTEDVSRHVDI